MFECDNEMIKMMCKAINNWPKRINSIHIDQATQINPTKKIIKKTIDYSMK